MTPGYQVAGRVYVRVVNKSWHELAWYNNTLLCWLCTVATCRWSVPSVLMHCCTYSLSYFKDVFLLDVISQQQHQPGCPSKDCLHLLCLMTSGWHHAVNTTPSSMLHRHDSSWEREQQPRRYRAYSQQSAVSSPQENYPCCTIVTLLPYRDSSSLETSSRNRSNKGGQWLVVWEGRKRRAGPGENRPKTVSKVLTAAISPYMLPCTW